MSAQTEAKDPATVTVKWRTIEFDVPLDRSQMSFETALALEEGKYSVAIREILPAGVYREFLATSPTAADGIDLVGAIIAALGLADKGE